ncbi:MAG: DUF92 domain-containing protein [Methanomassiliicoccales archaeon]
MQHLSTSVSPIETFAVILLLCCVLSLLAYKFQLLSASGSAASMIIGILIGWFGSLSWLLTLIFFVFAGFIVTRFKLRVKIERGLQEGEKGERTYRNVLANGLVPTVVALLAYFTGTQDEFVGEIAYISAVSVAAADTTASELGVLSDKTYLITNFKKVRPGTNGGISLFGTLCAILAAVLSSVIGWISIISYESANWLILVPFFSGIIGCMVDSLIGATLEDRGYVSKLTTNIISMFVGAAIGAIITTLFY